MSTNIKNLSSRKKKEATSALLSLARSIQDEDPVVFFINHLLTESEQITIGRRILIARMLLSGHNRFEIRSQLSVSPNTFSRTRKWLEKELPNYGDALKNFEKQQEVKETTRRKNKREYVDPLSLKALQQRYPMHFLLFSLFSK